MTRPPSKPPRSSSSLAATGKSHRRGSLIVLEGGLGAGEVEAREGAGLDATETSSSMGSSLGAARPTLRGRDGGRGAGRDPFGGNAA